MHFRALGELDGLCFNMCESVEENAVGESVKFLFWTSANEIVLT